MSDSREAPGRAQREGGHLPAKGRGLRRNQPADTLILDVQPPKLAEASFSYLTPSPWYFVVAALTTRYTYLAVLLPLLSPQSRCSLQTGGSRTETVPRGALAGQHSGGGSAVSTGCEALADLTVSGWTVPCPGE